MQSGLIEKERERRFTVWAELSKLGPTGAVLPGTVKELRIHRGQQGVFRDLEATSQLTPSSAGIAVGLLYTGSSYADDLDNEGMIYHYPVTDRGERDTNEVTSVTLCEEYSLPLFVVIKHASSDRTRDVRIGWVAGHDDESRQLLIIFGAEMPASSGAGPSNEERPFHLIVRRNRRRSTTMGRPGQAQFRFEVFKRYGTNCAFCDIIEPTLLEAAHLCPVESGGSDDERNGLVMCLNHHKAFDLGILRIRPDSLDVFFNPAVKDPHNLGVSKYSIADLSHIPHRDALQWAWNRDQ